MLNRSPSDNPAQLKLLRLLEEHPEYSQRQLAIALGVSLGKTHYLLKALLEKGLVKAQKFGRSERKLSYLYVLTPSGVQHRVQLTKAFLERKELDYRLLRTEIAALRKEVASQSDVR